MASGSVFVGNRRVVLVDVNSAADAGEHKSSVVLDGAQLEKLASLPQLRGGEMADNFVFDVTPTSDRLSERDVRAVIASRLIGLMRSEDEYSSKEGKKGSKKDRVLPRAAVRVDILTFLAELLNQRIYVSLPSSSDEQILRALWNCTRGTGKCVVSGKEEDLFEVLQTRNIPLPASDCQKRAIDVFTSGISPWVGIAAVEVKAAGVALDLCDVAVALACEQVGMNTSGFNSVAMEKLRNKPGAKQVCDNLSTLLYHSSLSKSDAKGSDPLLYDTPAAHGSARDTQAQARRDVIVELNAFPDLSSLAEFRSESFGASIRSLSSALMLPLRASCSRWRRGEADGDTAAATFLQRARKLLRSDPEIPIDMCTRHEVLALREVVASLRGLVTKEIFRSVTTLKERQATKVKEVTRIQAEKEKKRQQMDKDKGVDESKLSEKEKKKRAKAADKSREAIEKAQKMGIGEPLLELLSWLDNEEQRDFYSSDETTRLNALDVYSNRFAQFLSELIEAKRTFRNPECPKGTKDTSPEEMVIREKAFRQITNVFHRHGAVGIDTPVFELRETLTGKYGEDSKLIYDLADQGGEALSLRYDLTVPFARYCAQNQVGDFKRYHIGKVYRRDNPVVTKGKFREFYQCDFDIAGHCDPMIAEADVLAVVCEILDVLDLGGYVVKVNNRVLLDAIMEISGVPSQKFRPICSAIDKLDKMSWDDVKDEMVNQKGLDAAAADRIWEFVQHKGAPMELLERIMAAPEFAGLREHALASKTLREMKMLFTYLECLGAVKNVSFDLSLARGLDYYTGLIYEAILTEQEGGSIAGGGRYDGLIGVFSHKPIPAVGASIGIARILALLANSSKKDDKGTVAQRRKNHTQVVVACNKESLLEKRLEMVSMLWRAGIAAELVYKENIKSQEQIKFALKMQCPFMVFLDPQRLEQNEVQIKDMEAKTEEYVAWDEVAPTLLAKYLKALTV